jgi:coproporphyrinogen III oxidase-like Fe-S oxidoreductase
MRQPLCVAQTPAEVSEERLLVGLRLAEGVPVSSSEQTRLRRFVERGWLEEPSEGRIRLTSEGVLFSNEVFEEFVHA